jgi:transcriptional regulator with XRE-family HTH domain
MSSTSENGKAWQEELAARVGSAIARRRKVVGMTAQQLGERTKELGYPVNRVAVSKMEANVRDGKLGVAELLVIAAALDVPPLLLLLPDWPDGSAEALPGLDMPSRRMANWVTGVEPPPLPIRLDSSGMTGRVPRPDVGVRLVGLMAHRDRLDADLANARRMALGDEWPGGVESAQRMIAEIIEELALLEHSIAEAKADVWGADA